MDGTGAFHLRQGTEIAIDNEERVACTNNSTRPDQAIEIVEHFAPGDGFEVSFDVASGEIVVNGTDTIETPPESEKFYKLHLYRQGGATRYSRGSDYITHFWCKDCQKDAHWAGDKNEPFPWCGHLQHFFASGFDRLAWAAMPRDTSTQYLVPIIPNINEFVTISLLDAEYPSHGPVIWLYDELEVRRPHHMIGPLPEFATGISIRAAIYNWFMENADDMRLGGDGCSHGGCKNLSDEGLKDHDMWCIIWHGKCYVHRLTDYRESQARKAEEEREAEELAKLTALLADVVPDTSSSPHVPFTEPLKINESKLKAFAYSMGIESGPGHSPGRAASTNELRAAAQAIRSGKKGSAETDDPVPAGVEATYGDDFPVPKPENTRVFVNANQHSPQEVAAIQARMRQMGMI